jgi:hypothetical protein
VNNASVLLSDPRIAFSCNSSQLCAIKYHKMAL